MDAIKITGARSHNLKNLSLSLPKNRLVVITGLSGSGKSTLAFDTIYAEGQRRYVESLSAYARQFLEQMDKPDVESIEGLSPAIAIQQHSPSRNPRSTAGTVTEIYDYLRLLYAKAGRPHCPSCGGPIKAWSAQGIVKELEHAFAGRKIAVFAPLVRGRIGTYEDLFSRLKKAGFVKVMVDGELVSLDKVPALKRYIKHDIDLFIDEFTPGDDRERAAEAVELALAQSRGMLRVKTAGGRGTGTAERGQRNGDTMPHGVPRRCPPPMSPADAVYSEKNACPKCAISFPELEPRLFSFNSPHGACPACTGLGVSIEADPALVVTDPSKTIAEGAIEAWSNPVTTRTHRWKNSWGGYYAGMLEDFCRKARIPSDKPWKSLTAAQRKLVLAGDPEAGFEGVMTNLRRRYTESESDFVREEVYRRFMHEITCPACGGARLKPEPLSVLVGGMNIARLSALSIGAILAFLKDLKLTEKEKEISRLILKEINSRLGFLDNVGLSYITLDRRSETLSGGEAQRIQLATQIGSGLTGVLYVLDEPTIGLHQRDNAKLINTLRSLRDIGNTLIVVEHDEAVIRAADHVVDLGPGAGAGGGEIVAQGSPADILKSKASLTGAFMRGERSVAFDRPARRGSGNFLEFLGASQFNLKNIDVKLPLGLFVSICGVSGSGKSTLLYEIIYKALAKKLYGSKDAPGAYRAMKGDAHLDKAVIVDQSPIGRTPRSNPATYTGAFNHIRDLFSKLPEARRRGYQPGRFSFNVKGGRCEACQGDGTIKIQMQFLPDVYVRCDECGGRRFNDETLSVKYKGKSISEVLDLSIGESSALFADIPQISRILAVMDEVGLGYLKLGQGATTLSGGEAQRLKLAEQLCRRSTGRTIYILDEPTTGLHFADVEKLLRVLHRLADQGNTVLVIEHNLDVIASSDWMLELGPGGGESGGRLLYAGTVDGAAAPAGAGTPSGMGSPTGAYLREKASLLTSRRRN
ncbi:MAG: excinuclease ABC subunit A [Elusimicrobia bacterium]|nr:MAG: excinuclease ABC subunit A [Elusimicrobiota bacterium]KAF0156580.1 MAG: excinuclease ABC subunit A [Elusimicrobiota bacterium]